MVILQFHIMNTKILKLAKFLKQNGYSKEYIYLKKIAEFATETAEYIAMQRASIIASENPYSVLGLRENATEKEIRAAYREFARKNPQGFTSTNASSAQTAMVKRINNAYEILKDPNKKAIYDQALKEGTAGTRAAAQSAAQGAAKKAAMTIDELISYAGKEKAINVRAKVDDFIKTNPKLTYQQTEQLRNAINNNPKISPWFKRNIKGDLRNLNQELWDRVSSSSRASETSAQGAAKPSPKPTPNPSVKPSTQGAAQSAETAAAEAAASGKGAASKVVANPATMSRLATAGRIAKGIAGYVVLDIAGRAVIDSLMSETVKNGWNYSVNLSTSFVDIAGYNVIGGIGNVFDSNGKEIKKSVIDYVTPGGQAKRIGEEYNGSGARQPESRVFVPAGVVVEMILSDGNASVIGTFKIDQPDSRNGIASLMINDAMIKDAFERTMAGDKETEQALSSGSLGEIAEKQMRKVETSKQLAKEMFGTGVLLGGATYSAGGAAAFTAGGAASAGATITGGGLLLGGVAAAGVAGAALGGYALGTAINNSLEANDIVLGRSIHQFFSELGKVGSKFKYRVGLEQTDFIKKNVKEFQVTVAKGKLYDKAGIFSFEEKGKLSKEEYTESMKDPSGRPPTEIIETLGSGGYANGGVFVPEFIATKIIFNDGKSLALFSPAVMGEIGVAACTVAAKDIVDKYNKKYPQNAVQVGTQQAPSEVKQTQKPYSRLGGKSVALKAILLDVGQKAGVIGDYTPQDVAKGDWDKKADDLMVRVVNKTFKDVLSPALVKKMSGQLGEGKVWRWSSIAPQIGYPTNIDGAIKYVQDANAKLIAKT